MPLLKLPLFYESIAWFYLSRAPFFLTLARFCFMMKYGKTRFLISCMLAEAQHYPTETTVWLLIYLCKHMQN